MSVHCLCNQCWPGRESERVILEAMNAQVLTPAEVRKKLKLKKNGIEASAA